VQILTSLSIPTILNPYLRRRSAVSFLRLDFEISVASLLKGCPTDAPNQGKIEASLLSQGACQSQKLSKIVAQGDRKTEMSFSDQEEEDLANSLMEAYMRFHDDGSWTLQKELQLRIYEVCRNVYLLRTRAAELLHNHTGVTKSDDEVLSPESPQPLTLKNPLEIINYNPELA
jgi:hypothetical protein